MWWLRNRFRSCRAPCFGGVVLCGTSETLFFRPPNLKRDCGLGLGLGAGTGAGHAHHGGTSPGGTSPGGGDNYAKQQYDSGYSAEGSSKG